MYESHRAVYGAFRAASRGCFVIEFTHERALFHRYTVLVVAARYMMWYRVCILLASNDVACTATMQQDSIVGRGDLLLAVCQLQCMP